MKKVVFILMAIIMCTHVSAQEKCISSKGYALFSKDENFQSYEFTRHSIGDHDILIRNLYCDICHSDIHQVHNHCLILQFLYCYLFLAAKVGINKETGFTIKSVSFTIISYSFL